MSASATQAVRRSGGQAVRRSGGQADYHLHALVADCIGHFVVAGGEPEPTITFAFDGFPVEGPQGCLDEACAELSTFTSGWVQIGDPATHVWDNHERGGDADCEGQCGDATMSCTS